MQKELPVRKDIRLQGYNYSNAGYYFITICVKNGHEMLGTVVGDAHPGVPFVQLTDIGIIVKQHIDNISMVYDFVKIDKYVVMPNHIHFIVIIENKVGEEVHGTPGCASPTKFTLAKLINAFKSLTSRQFGESMW